jgi:Holliday junction resolvase-like predicted endonuclease
VHPSCQTLGVISHTAFQVENQVWLKVVIILGTLLFASVAVVFAWQAYVAPSMEQSSYQLVAVLGSTWLTSVGLRLIKYINYTLEVGELSVIVRSANQIQTLAWAELRIRDRTTVQVTELRDHNDNLLYAVDWYAKNARLFATTYSKRTAGDA